MQIVDGWELNGQLFPSAVDHEKRLEERYHETCGRKRIYPARFYSSQNAALIQYRIPLFGQGFSVRVQHVVNPRRTSATNFLYFISISIVIEMRVPTVSLGFCSIIHIF